MAGALQNHFILHCCPIEMAFPGGRLSVGSISKIYAGNFSDPVVLQVLEVKKMVSNNKAASTGDRFRYVPFIGPFSNPN